MKKSYFIFPIILMVAFYFYYRNFTVENAIKEAEEEKQRIELIAAEEAQQAEAELRAKEDSDRRTAEREASDAEKIAERRAKWAASGQEIADDTAKYSTEGDKFAQEKADLELTLLETRNAHQKLSAETFELRKAVELGLVAKRTAELNERRFVEMVSIRAKASAMAQMPPPPPPPTD